MSCILILASTGSRNSCRNSQLWILEAGVNSISLFTVELPSANQLHLSEDFIHNETSLFSRIQNGAEILIRLSLRFPFGNSERFK